MRWCIANWLSRREGRMPAYRLAGKEKIKDYEDKEVEVENGRLTRELMVID